MVPPSRVGGLIGSRCRSDAGSQRIWLVVHEQITAYDAPRSCSYRVVGGFPPAHQDGTLTCTPSGNGTHVDWVSGYTIPARGGGKVLEVLTAPLMRSLVFRKILAGCAKALEV